MGRRRRVRRLLVRPCREPRAARRPGLVLRPQAPHPDLKVLLGVNPDPSVDGAFDGPDNITVSPYGGIVLAEDGEGISHLFGATDSGRTYPIARNDLNIGTEEQPEYSEFAGVTFSPDGKTLYANIQTPGILLAITGPWKRQKRS
ncbi:alkaline phosphatase PhoX [Streptomyces scabiei]|uniref:alkaline phosphatase PhoX n=1 Tax=Streptomyces scabiei TaxID=1930 RepID=UPI0038D3618A